MAEITDRLKEIRRENKLTQQQIADYLGITQSAYAYYETGRSMIDIETLKKLADYYRVSLDYLAGRYK